MERTNYLDKAKRLMAQTARTAALVIVPLAAAVSAQAGTILPTGNQTCSTQFGSPQVSGSCSFDVSAISGSALTGVSFSSQSGGINLFSSGAGTDTLIMSVGGTLTGPLPSVIPVDFSTTITNAQSGGSWSVTMELDDAIGLTDTFTGTLTAGSNTLTGSASFFIFNAGLFPSGSTITERVTLSYAVVSGNSNITFPFNFEGVAATATPEPGTIGGAAAGLGLIGWLLRRRRAKA